MRPISILSAIAASGMLAYFGAAWIVPGPASAEEVPLPEHLQLEQDKQLLERQNEVLRLKQEMEEIRDSDINSKIKKFGEILVLLKTEKEIRDLLREDPSLFALYRASAGGIAGAMTLSDVLPGYSEGDPLSQFCSCLSTTRVKWLGEGQQDGDAVLSVAGNEIELSVGDKLGKTLCYLREATSTHATIECRDPIQKRKHIQSIALQTMPRTR